MRRLLWTLATLVGIALVVAAAGWWAFRSVEQRIAPDPTAIVDASLQGLREQQRISALVASYVAVVTATERRFGLEAKKTLIMPGMVRYEVDLARLGPADLSWNADSRTLDVVLPDVQISGPQIDLTRIREYDGGGVLMRITDAEGRLDAANRRAGQQELLRQARLPAPMGIARDAARRAVQRSFALPLRAAGVDARIRVRFAHEPGFPADDGERIERSRAAEEVYRNGAG